MECANDRYYLQDKIPEQKGRILSNNGSIFQNKPFF